MEEKEEWGDTVLTDIRETKRGRLALFSGEIFLFSVDAETCARFHLTIGQQFSAPELAQLREESDLRAAKDKALQYLSLRDYAEQELYEKLCRKFDEPTSAAAVAEMHRLELLDDANFARHRAASLRSRGKSRLEIGVALSRLGIDRALADEALAELPEDDRGALQRLVEKSYLGKLVAGKKDNVVAALLRRGYSLKDIKAVLEEVSRDEEESD